MNEIVTERTNLFEPNVYIAVCVALAGKVEPDKLSAAVKQAYEVNEAVMSKVVLEHGFAYYEKLPVSNCKIEVADQNKDWIKLVKENEKCTFAIDQGELVRTFIIPLEDKTQIVIMAHHLAGDGKSIMYFVKDIMNALAGVPLIDKPLTLLTKNLLPRKGLSVSAKLFARYCRHHWNDSFWEWEDYYALHAKYWEKFSSDIQYETFSVEETKRIIEDAKRIGCSVNSYLVTRFLQKYAKRCEVGIPVSIRQSRNEAMANLTSGIRIVYKYHMNRTFAENAVRVHKQIAKELKRKRVFVLQFLAELPVTLMDAVLLQTYHFCDDRLAKITAKVMGYIGKNKKDMGVTNLTVLDIPASYGDYEIENIIFVPPAVSYSDHIIGISTFRGRMTISYHNMTMR